MTSSAPVPLWDEWGRITRFLEGARLAFARESDLWTSLQLKPPVKRSVSTGQGAYEVELGDHLEAVGDEETLFASVLIHSYAVAEAAAADKLAVDSRTFDGIEDWGDRLLQAEGRSWSRVKDGLAGAVEVAVARNVLAHGRRRLDAAAARRLNNAGRQSRRAGAIVRLDYPTLHTYRARLRSLLQQGGLKR